MVTEYIGMLGSKALITQGKNNNFTICDGVYMAQRVVLFAGADLLEKLCHCGCGLKTLTLAACELVFC
jgi:hypothetical protein